MTMGKNLYVCVILVPLFAPSLMTVIYECDSQRGPCGPPVVPLLEFLVIHTEFHKSLIKRSLTYAQYSFEKYFTRELSA